MRYYAYFKMQNGGKETCAQAQKIWGGRAVAIYKTAAAPPM